MPLDQGLQPPLACAHRRCRIRSKSLLRTVRHSKRECRPQLPSYFLWGPLSSHRQIVFSLYHRPSYLTPCHASIRVVEALKNGLGDQVKSLVEAQTETVKRVGAVEASLSQSMEGLNETITSVSLIFVVVLSFSGLVPDICCPSTIHSYHPPTHSKVKAQVKKEPEVSFADFSKVQGQVDSAVRGVASVAEAINNLREGDLHM